MIVNTRAALQVGRSLNYAVPVAVDISLPVHDNWTGTIPVVNPSSMHHVE